MVTTMEGLTSYLIKYIDMQQKLGHYIILNEILNYVPYTNEERETIKGILL